VIDAPRIVLDTNVLLRALANIASPSGRLIQVCEVRRAIALLSKPVMKEYRTVLSRVAELHEAIRAEDIQLLLRKLKYLGDYLPVVHAKFSFARDPTDAKLIELAIEGRATHLASFDHDLLSLAHSRTDAGKRFRQRLPNLHVMMPGELLLGNPQLER
jgi:uncharacterized protein